MTRYRVRHRTDYRYGAPVTSGQTIAHLAAAGDAGPAGRRRADVRRRSRARPPSHPPRRVRQPRDVSSASSSRTSTSRSPPTSEVEVEPPPTSADGAHGPAWEDVARPAGDRHLARRPPGPGVRARLAARRPLRRRWRPTPRRRSRRAARSTRRCATSAERIFTEFVFDPAFTDVTHADRPRCWRPGVACARTSPTSPSAACGRSACRRATCSGYLETRAAAGPAEARRRRRLPRLVLRCTCPAAGWLDVDPTNDQVPPHDHVTVAWGRDYGDVAPVRGVVFGPATNQELAVAVDVERAGRLTGTSDRGLTAVRRGDPRTRPVRSPRCGGYSGSQRVRARAGMARWPPQAWRVTVAPLAATTAARGPGRERRPGRAGPAAGRRRSGATAAPGAGRHTASPRPTKGVGAKVLDDESASPARRPPVGPRPRPRPVRPSPTPSPAG